MLFIFPKIAWVLSIAVRFRGCSLVRWRASNDELRSLPTQRSGSLTLSPSYLAHTLSVAFASLLSRSRSRRFRSPAHTLFLFLFPSCRCSQSRATRKGHGQEYAERRARDKDGEHHAQAPRTYILTGAICEAVKAPPASATSVQWWKKRETPAAPCRKIRGCATT